MSKRQLTVAKSSTESEYIALSTAAQEGIWLRRLLEDVGIKPDGSTTIFEDNQSAIQLSKNPKYHNRTKHIDVSFHFIREHVNSGTLSVKYCCTQEMIADVMTKGLSGPLFIKFRELLGLYKLS